MCIKIQEEVREEESIIRGFREFIFKMKIKLCLCSNGPAIYKGLVCKER